MNTLENGTCVESQEAITLSHSLTSNEIEIDTTAIVTEDSNSNENFEFVINPSDTVFVLTINHAKHKVGVSNIISKMIVLKESCTVYLDELSVTLKDMGIDKLHIFSIRCDYSKASKSAVSQRGSSIVYIDLKETEFRDFLIKGPESGSSFLEYNPHSLYILRGGNYLSIKNIFSSIENRQVNLGRGGSQKSHLLSPLDLRLTCYMLALFDYNTLKYLNTFNEISKNRYLSYTDYTYKSVKIKGEPGSFRFKALKVNVMPLHDVNLEEHNFLNCLDGCKNSSKEILA